MKSERRSEREREVKVKRVLPNPLPYCLLRYRLTTVIETQMLLGMQWSNIIRAWKSIQCLQAIVSIHPDAPSSFHLCFLYASGTLMSCMTVMLFLGLANIFFGSYLIYQVSFIFLVKWCLYQCKMTSKAKILLTRQAIFNSTPCS